MVDSGNADPNVGEWSDPAQVSVTLIDVTHKDDSITRLFGVMTDMSEDHPTAAIIPKFACNMKVTHIVELDSSGNIQGNGYKPLGGDVIDVGQYLSAA